MARKIDALIAAGILLAVLVVPLMLFGSDADIAEEAATVGQTSSASNSAISMFLAMCGIAVLFFLIICAPGILSESFKKHQAVVNGVPYETKKPIKVNCPDCGVMVEEDYGFCSKCGKVFTPEIRKGIPSPMSVGHIRYS